MPTSANRMLAAAAAAVALAGAGMPPAGTHHLVACAPGYPGDTAQAQPTMDAFAAMLSEVAGWEHEALSAEYQETETGGLERLADTTTTIALLPLAFFLKHELELELHPLAQVVQADGNAIEHWSLVAAKGRVTDAQDLVGWQIAGVPGYAPRFVRGPALGDWGVLPLSVEVMFADRVVRQLRRAVAGESVAVLLDAAQTSALGSLPSGDKLEIVATSPPLIAALLVAVGDRIDADAVQELLHGVLRVHETERFYEVLETLRVARFEALDSAALERARAAYRATE